MALAWRLQTLATAVQHHRQGPSPFRRRLIAPTASWRSSRRRRSQRSERAPLRPGKTETGHPNRSRRSCLQPAPGPVPAGGHAGETAGHRSLSRPRSWTSAPCLSQQGIALLFPLLAVRLSGSVESVRVLDSMLRLLLRSECIMGIGRIRSLLALGLMPGAAAAIWAQSFNLLPGAAYPAGNGPLAIASGDFNGDG